MSSENININDLKKQAQMLLKNIEENQNKEKMLKKQIEEESDLLEMITKEIKYYEQNKECRITILSTVN